MCRWHRREDVPWGLWWTCRTERVCAVSFNPQSSVHNPRDSLPSPFHPAAAQTPQWQEDSPHTGFADSDPWPSEILTQPGIVLGESPEFELGHGLLVRARGDHRHGLFNEEGG